MKKSRVKSSSEEEEKDKEKDKEKEEEKVKDTEAYAEPERDDEYLKTLCIIQPEEIKKPEPLAVKLPKIVYWFKQSGAGGVSNEVLRVVRADKSYVDYTSFQYMIMCIDREDLVEIYEVGKRKFDGKELDDAVMKKIWGCLKQMFEPKTVPHILKKFSTVKMWILRGRSEVHYIALENGNVLFFLVEREYELIRNILKTMLEVKLHTDATSHMALDLLYKVHCWRDKVEKEHLAAMRKDQAEMSKLMKMFKKK